MAYEHFAMTVRSVLPRDQVLGVPALLARYPGSGLPRGNVLPSHPEWVVDSKCLLGWNGGSPLLCSRLK